MLPCFFPSGMLGLWRKRVARVGAAGWAVRTDGFPGFFSFLYFKKIKISKIYDGFEKFQNYTLVAPCLGDRGPVAPWLGDRT